MLTITKTEATLLVGNADGNATIGVLVKNGTLTAIPLKVAKKTGEEIKPEDLSSDTKLTIEFTTPEAVDVWIEALQVLRNNWRSNFEPAQAC